MKRKLLLLTGAIIATALVINSCARPICSDIHKAGFKKPPKQKKH